MSTDQHVTDHPDNPRAQQDAVLFDRLQRFVDRRGVVDAADTLGVNYRTLSRCLENGRLSRRVREAARKLPEDDAGEQQPPPETEPQPTMEQRIQALEQAVGKVAGAQADVQARLARLEAARGSEPPEPPTAGQPTGEQPTVEDAPQQGWAPPKRAFGMPRPGVVTTEPQDDEAVAFGPAAGLVVEWRAIRNGGKEGRSGVARARAAERRWELEVAMIGEFGLTLPPEEEPLDHERRHDHLRWRTKALERTRRIRVRRENRRSLRRFLTLGLWWE
ncbi:MAG: hypothetical protein OXK21_11510 [Chloroflexota bacterium]|nr:hypothetical protein [Chloroflexota bacterium]